MSFEKEMENKNFKNTLNGYNKVEVDQFIAKMMIEFNTLKRENEDLKKTNDVNAEKIKYYMTLEKTMENSMDIAQKTFQYAQNFSEKSKTRAEKEAEDIISKAMDQAKNIIDRTNEQNEMLKKEYQKYCDEFDTFKIRVANFIETQKNVFSTSLEDLELSPLDLSSFEEYVLKNIADEREVDHENLQESDEPMVSDEFMVDQEDQLIKG